MSHVTWRSFSDKGCTITWSISDGRNLNCEATEIIVIESLYTNTKQRRQGHAKDLLRRFLNSVDEYDWPVMLLVCSTNEKGVPNDTELMEFYSQFSFKELQDGWMYRERYSVRFNKQVFRHGEESNEHEPAEYYTHD
jgi:hypothetical protein